MEQALEMTGAIVGLLYLWLEYRASIYLWIAGIIMPAIYLSVYFEAGLYADFGINLYYLGAAVYGWVMWKYGRFVRRKLHLNARTQSTELPITQMPARYYLRLLWLFSASFVGIALILIHFTNSNVPWLDSFTTALSIVGMWMLARKYVEQWWVWIVVDVVCVGLYVYKDLHYTAALYALYTIIAIFGYFKWKRMMNEHE